MGLAVLVFNSHGAAYQALHLIGLEPALECLELIPMGSQAQLLIKGAPEKLRAFLPQLSVADVESITFVEKWNQKIERAFYSLEHSKLRESLIFIENKSLGPLFLAAEAGIERGYEIVDLKIPRGSVRWGILILTGDSEASESLQDLRVKGNQVTQIQSPSGLLRKYFDIEV
ncbi:MAG: hypothetical protein ACK5P7_06720 [Bdellovibrio sp.]|jgi:hypothetical protein